MKTPTTPRSSSRSAPIDNFEKGREFEKYVKELFNEDSFTVSKWRESKRFDDPFQLEDCGNPDLELIFRGRKNYHFAVECKWREKFINGKMIWATDIQLCSYLNFENRFRIPVFIAIGIGGQPSRPEKLFVTPLRNMEIDTEVYESNLIPYKRKPTRKFFYDTAQLKLF
jgi:hypothetical protein